MSSPTERAAAGAHPASFRDPSGFIFRGADGLLYRQVNRSYEAHYRQLMDGGLYQTLTSDGSLIPHEEADPALALTADAVCVLRPRELPSISYPYEWAFSALQDAALLTLRIQSQALDAGMTLKDASAYNIQFDGVRPVFIDSLSFEVHEEGSPWVAYAQFCRHFLAPLALMARADIRLGRLLTLYVDGVPLDLAAKLLPWRTRFNLGLMAHVHLLARMTDRYSDTSAPEAAAKPGRKVSTSGLRAILDNLRATVERLTWRPAGTEWADYYENTSYSEAGFEQKQTLVEQLLKTAAPTSVWDLGANTGEFSRIAARLGARTCAFDIDPACVERNYRACREQQTAGILPLVLDLTNPSPALGWASQERESFAERRAPDLILALALIHHLAISNNLPFAHIATFLAERCTHLVIEFVPKGDPQVQRLLRSREDIFVDYHAEGFEAAFGASFELLESHAVGSDGRQLYLMRRRL